MLSIPANIQALVASGRFKKRVMLQFDLDSGSTGLWNDTYDVTYGGVFFAGISGNIVVPAFTGSAALDVGNLEVQVSGLSAAAQNIIGNLVWHQRPATAFIAFLNDAGVIQFQIARYSGFLDAAPMVDQADGTAALHIIIENSNRALDRASGDTRSDASQRARGGSTDGFFKYAAIAAVQSGTIVWGQNGPQSPVDVTPPK